MVSFPQASPPTPCAHLFPPPYAPHAQPISFFSILPPAHSSTSSSYKYTLYFRISNWQSARQSCPAQSHSCSLVLLFTEQHKSWRCTFRYFSVSCHFLCKSPHINQPLRTALCILHHTLVTVPAPPGVCWHHRQGATPNCKFLAKLRVVQSRADFCVGAVVIVGEGDLENTDRILWFIVCTNKCVRASTYAHTHTHIYIYIYIYTGVLISP
jgi:hypothetical protein